MTGLGKNPLALGAGDGWAHNESPDMELADRPSVAAMHSWKAPG